MFQLQDRIIMNGNFIEEDEARPVLPTTNELNKIGGLDCCRIKSDKATATANKRRLQQTKLNE